MRAHFSYEGREPYVHWTLRSHDSRLMTPDRLIASGIVETLRGAWASGELAWNKFIESPDWQALNHSETEEA